MPSFKELGQATLGQETLGQETLGHGECMFRVKVCGITNIGDAREAVAAGVDAVGLNFFSRSARRVEPARAAEIAAELPVGVCRVGVFVNHSADEIRACIREVGLDLAQLHGDERPEMARELGGIPVLRALRCRPDDWERGADWLDQFVSQGGCLKGALIDAYHPEEYGGTGRLADLQVFQAFRDRFPRLPLLLAGGLTPDNVGGVIRQVRPDGVDTASGVEESPGLKNAMKMRAFVAAARAAWDLLERAAGGDRRD